MQQSQLQEYERREAFLDNSKALQQQLQSTQTQFLEQQRAKQRLLLRCTKQIRMIDTAQQKDIYRLQEVTFQRWRAEAIGTLCADVQTLRKLVLTRLSRWQEYGLRWRHHRCRHTFAAVFRTWKQFATFVSKRRRFHLGRSNKAGRAAVSSLWRTAFREWLNWSQRRRSRLRGELAMRARIAQMFLTSQRAYFSAWQAYAREAQSRSLFQKEESTFQKGEPARAGEVRPRASLQVYVSAG